MKTKKTKSRFPHPYIKYWKDPDLCMTVKQKYLEHKNSLNEDCHFVSRIAALHGINRKTLRGWMKKWDEDKSWNPFYTKNHGSFHRIFNDQQEDNIMEYIDANYISEGNYFSDSQFQTVVFDAFNLIHEDDLEIPNFNCSAHFIHDFKTRHNVSSKMAHFKQRSKNNPKSDNTYVIDEFKATIQSVIENARLKGEPVVNGDETGFQILPNCVKTWAYKNSSNVSINVLDSTKERISVMASITSTNCKLPLFIIAGANSEEENDDLLGQLIEPNISTFSKKSYMTTENFIEYLNFIRKQFNSEIPIHLIVDSYASHKSLKSIMVAKQLNINLYFIPSGLTDILQPLDLSIFAPLKSKVNSKISNYLFGNQEKEVGMKRTVTFVQKAFEELSIDNLVYAWSQYY